MKTIRAFKTTDGRVFEDENQAETYQKQLNCEKAFKEILEHFKDASLELIKMSDEAIDDLSKSMAKNPAWVIALLEQAMGKK